MPNEQMRFLTADEETALRYWKDKEFKVWAVDYAAGPRRKPTRRGTHYVRARTAARAIANCRENVLPPLPAAARLVVRLAGPAELGAAPTPGFSS